MTPADLHGPITTGRPSPPADPRPVDLADAGYVEEEWFASGTATTYEADGELGGDGHWNVTAAATASYTTRAVVRRPADTGRFCGAVVVEWLNVSAVEASPEWTYTSRALVDAGAAWVGVSVQALGVVGGTPIVATGGDDSALPARGIRDTNPKRYATLEHPGDAFAFDIYAQVGAALRAENGRAALGGAAPRRVVAVGESQSAAFLVTQHNAFQPRTPVFDAYLIHSRGSSGAQLDGSRFVGEGAPSTRLRTDLDVPVLVFETETDLGPRLRFGEARQPDHDRLRTWEVAGTAHADAYLVGKDFPLCPHGINDGPQHYVVNAAMEALLRWADGGDPPPHAEPIAVDGTTVLRDELGLALGGVRTPSVDVPVARLSGEAPPGAPLLCALFGSSTPFDDATLARLYPSREAYVSRFDRALDDAIAAGFVRERDRAMYAAEARRT